MGKGVIADIVMNEDGILSHSSASLSYSLPMDIVLCICKTMKQSIQVQPLRGEDIWELV